MLQHADIWRAIDLLAERNGLSASGLAQKAGLSATSFNPSKRMHAGRKRWPSTESVSLILKATQTDLDSFVALAQKGKASPRAAVPLLRWDEAARPASFDAHGQPAGKNWEQTDFADLGAEGTFALELTDDTYAPLWRAGDRVVVAPQEKPRKGDRVLVCSKTGELGVWEWGRETAGKVTLTALAGTRKTVSWARDEIRWAYRIVGICL